MLYKESRKEATIILSIIILIESVFFFCIHVKEFYIIGFDNIVKYNIWILVLLMVTYLKDWLYKGITVIVVIVLLCLATVPSIPRRIATPEHFNKLCKVETGNFYVANDLDYTGMEKVKSTLGLEEVYHDCLFNGVLEGNNHTISNMDTYLLPATEFKRDMKGAIIRNFVFENSSSGVFRSIYFAYVDNITINNSVIGKDYTGLLVMDSWGGRLSNITINNPTINSDEVGGIMFRYYYTTYVNNVTINNISNNSSSFSLLGRNDHSNCESNISIKGYSASFSDITASITESNEDITIVGNLCDVEIHNMNITGDITLTLPDHLEMVLLENSTFNDKNIDRKID